MAVRKEKTDQTPPQIPGETGGLLAFLLKKAEEWPSTASLTMTDKERFIRELLQGESERDLQKRPEDEVAATFEYLWKKVQVQGFKDIQIDIQEDSFYQPDRVDITIIQRQMPFVTDSILNLLRQNHLYVSVMLNSAIKVRRDDEGKLLSIHDDNDHGPDLLSDKVLHLQCEDRGEKLDAALLKGAISDILRDVHAAVEDWKAMQGQIAETINDLEQCPETINGEDAYEAAQFLTFLKDGNFTFLGYREHKLRRDKKITHFDIQATKSLGILRDDNYLLFDGLITDDLIPEPVREILHSPEPLLMVLKANRHATVHRSVHMDVVMIKKYDSKGNVEALRLFSGLFTSQCYARPTEQIPYLKHKVNAVLVRANYDVDTHPWRALKHVLDSYPRDDLFQISTDQLYEHATGIARLSNRPEVDVFIRPDILQRYYSVMLYLPKDQYNTVLRMQTQTILEQELNGEVVAHYMMVNEKPLARLQYMIATGTLLLPEYNHDRLRQRLTEACMPWFERLKAETLKKFGKEKTQYLLTNLSQAFSISYQDQVEVSHAVDDLAPIQKTLHEKDIVVVMQRRQEDPEGHYRIKIYKRDEEARLSELLPMLDRMGFDCLHEYSYGFTPTGGLPKIWLHEMVGTFQYLADMELTDIEGLFAEAFDVIWHNKIDSDSFNTLVLAAGLNWREANLFRALARYLDLGNYPLGKRYIGQVLAKYPHITRRLKDIFVTQHDPKMERDKAEVTVGGYLVEVDHLFDKVEKLDEDRVLRSMLNIIRETLRTNYFHTDAEGKPLDVLVMKLNASALLDLPQPRPYREIFVYSNRVEAVHLRGGPIARGGIRWSDRYEDFRTEILGLVKAQIVKNSVIVPVGAKGGFICKNLVNAKSPQERQTEGIACYQIMVRSLLSITDNLVDGLIVAPENTVRLDGDDPYLVVAADKGTASFSNIANKISLDHGFWLGDAFASGGSNGYDHKEMGITARGAWECIKRHFRELGKDIQSEDFTVAGVGDMSGDVFGNGMLLSEHIKLVAVFDHRNIFIDPNPDPKKSFAERKRIFELPTSSWMDYNPKLISKGGMIYSRQDKSLTLTPEIKELLDITKDKVTPPELMQAVLRARVELMYFGGIGTYLKASHQTHDQAGDKANDAIRINANELRCKVLGEGANLGVTQLARIEYAQRGGAINTDFIDNAGGVDTSDHEVNIKILLQPLVNAKKLPLPERDKLLEEMTEDVGQHVLQNNYDQSLALSLAQVRAADHLPEHAQFIRQLEKQNLLNRQLEFLPDEETIQRLGQKHQGLSRPELAVLLAYSKITLFNQLVNSPLVEDKAVEHQLFEYFPTLLQNKFKNEIPTHKLSREIIATEVTNVIVNRMGPTFVTDTATRLGVEIWAVARAWLLVREAFDLREMWHAIDSLDNRVPATVQNDFYQKMIDIMDHGTVWFLQHYNGDMHLEKLIPLYREHLKKLLDGAADVLPQALQKRVQDDMHKLEAFPDIKPDVKQHLAELPMLLAGCDVIYLSQKTSIPVIDIAKIYFVLSDRLRVGTLQQLITALPTETSWAQEAVESLDDGLRTQLAGLSQQYLSHNPDKLDVEGWLNLRQTALQNYDTTMADIERMGTADLPLLMVVVQRLRHLIDLGEHA